MKVLYFSLILVIIDQLTKICVKGYNFSFLKLRHEGMYLGESHPIIGNFFRFTFVENPGMAFGIDLDPTVKLAVSLFSIVASIGLVYYLYTVRNNGLGIRLSLAFILGGAIGNLIDRVFYGLFYGYGQLFYGKVVDFFDFNFFRVELLGRTYERFPIFNIADIAVSLGVISLIILFWREGSNQKKEEVIVVDSGSDLAVEVPEVVVDAVQFQDNPEMTSENNIIISDEKVVPTENIIFESIVIDQEVTSTISESRNEDSGRTSSGDSA